MVERSGTGEFIRNEFCDLNFFDSLYSILAFFPEYQLKVVPSRSLRQMLDAYARVKDVGVGNVRLGNIGIFVKTEEELALLQEAVK